MNRFDVRVSPREFLELPLRVHAVLCDVPLHDVSVVDLPGGGVGRTIADVPSLLSAENEGPPTLAVRALFALRRWLGRIFGWDAESDATGQPWSYAHRLPDDLRGFSAVPVGTPEGSFTLLYRLDREELVEIRNATVHAFLCRALQPTADGYRLFWAIYVKPVSWVTPAYMALIEPFRRFVVYPAILGRARQAWVDRHPVPTLGYDA
jgi:hypothetical protein